MPWALLGGIVGGAIAWYLDAAQLDVIAAKLAAYATVHAPAPDYIIYPLFSKWGRSASARPKAASGCSTTSRCPA